MSGGKRRSGFQITSVTSDPHPATGQSAGSSLLAVVQSEGSWSQPTTPCLKRKQLSHDAPGLQRKQLSHDAPGLQRKQLSHDAPGLQSVVAVAAGSSRFRVVRLAAPAGGGLRGNEPYRRGRWTCSDFLERREGAGLRRLMDTRHAHSLESLELIGRDGEGAGLEGAGLKGAGLVLRSGPPSPSHSRQEPISIRLLDRNVPPPSPRIRNIPPPLRLDVDAAGRSVLRQSLSQPGSPSSGPFHPLTPAAFSLDQTIFTLQGDDSSPGNSLVAIDNKIEQAMDLVKSHLMLAVREEVELLREQIRELQDKNTQLERENHILRALTHNKHTT